ncbi:30S ribosomal protein S8 [bacterium BMS3Bbin06]|nr:30S ribosomal protein S8 [bacterium BMS3Abin08]GBE34398.1 30S ribosomal protein S8 [bacterium BMS3Bbin06]HDO34812.1 30S ribosomal protein S8 [Nitrospirota bacterium]
MVSDPVADMLTRIRNAIMVKAEKVDIPASRMKLDIAKILKEEGLIRAYKIIKDRKQGILRISLKYVDGVNVISGLKKVSKPGKRVYVGYRDIPRVMGGIGVSILTTPQGVRSDGTCHKEKIGGELLCYVW